MIPWDRAWAGVAALVLNLQAMYARVWKSDARSC